MWINVATWLRLIARVVSRIRATVIHVRRILFRVTNISSTRCTHARTRTRHDVTLRVHYAACVRIFICLIPACVPATWTRRERESCFSILEALVIPTPRVSCVICISTDLRAQENKKTKNKSRDTIGPIEEKIFAVQGGPISSGYFFSCGCMGAQGCSIVHVPTYNRYLVHLILDRVGIRITRLDLRQPRLYIRYSRVRDCFQLVLIASYIIHWPRHKPHLSAECFSNAMDLIA